MIRFWNKVDKGSDCWLWIGCTRQGYGSFSLNGKMVCAHRFSFEITKGPIPEGLILLHSCDNPLCVNPDHLTIGTHLDNNHDMIAKGRARHYSGGQHGMAKLSDEQREAILSDPRSGAAIARELGVNRSTINRIRSNKHG